MNLDYKKITAAIKRAEERTSGEIQVVVTKAKVHDVMAAAKAAFEKTGLGKTREHNAILFYISEKSHRFAILGDNGIHAVVDPGFWERLATELSVYFARHEFTEGLTRAIESCGEKLKTLFPRRESDVNELSDAVHVHDQP